MESVECDIIDLREEELDKEKVINPVKFSEMKYLVSPENVLSGVVTPGAH